MLCLRRPAFVALAFLAVASSLPAAALRWDAQHVRLEPAPFDESARARFAFTNTGPGAVTITGLESSCGCTVPNLEKRTYAPGESGTVEAEFTFGMRLGLQTKEVLVTTDETGVSTYLLTLEVAIPELYQAMPQFVSWRRGEPAAAKSIELRLLRPDLLQPASVESRDERIAAALEKDPHDPALFRVVLTPATTGASISAVVVVQMNQPADNPRVVTLYAIVR